MSSDALPTEDIIVEKLRTIYDPEIPVNVYDLGLIYGIEITDSAEVIVTMTLTTANCPAAESLPMQVEMAVLHVEGVQSATVNLTFEPPYEMSMMSEEAKLELGLL
jgi:FeS assembly SUF system protein